MISIKKITELAHFIAALAIREGDHVIDATAGNGIDTIFLAEKVGHDGYVYAFDIQKEALVRTAEKIKAKQFDERVGLIHAGHEELQKHVKFPVSVIMYNLGFLPGAESQITTASSTTFESFKQALRLLKPGGIITMVLYSGHPEGKNEIEILLPACENLLAREYAVIHTKLLNQANDPPELLVIQKNLYAPGKIG